MKTTPVIVWFRHDLRLQDNPALSAAVESGAPVVPVFIWSPQEEGSWPPGAASRWWLHQSLASLQGSLASLGSTLIIRKGPAAEALSALATESGAGSVFWNRRYEPAAIERDQNVKAMLRQQGLAAESFPGGLLFEPWTIRNLAGKPFQVFTPFWKACQAAPPPALPLPAPSHIISPAASLASLPLGDLALEPEIDWAGGLREAWRPGELGAAELLTRFREHAVESYSDERDRPDHAGTSRLSPHLHFGEISQRQIWQVFRDSPTALPYLRQTAWREFAHHLLFHFPRTPNEPLRSEFNRFPWRGDLRMLRAWTRGVTGYPLVDAGMRELWHTGWMHNRVRMVVASFLVKHLLISWQGGAAWFWDTLVDADLANNTLGWQWVAGCGADAAPYFRIFNPVIQGEKFDPDGDYVRRWIPELARLPNARIHKPWNAPATLLKDAGVELGKTYPLPVVVHERARERALSALAEMKSAEI